jgi:flagellar protein FlaG
MNYSLETSKFLRYNNREEFRRGGQDMDVTLKTTAILSTNSASKLSADSQPGGSVTSKPAKSYDYPKQSEANTLSRDDAEQVTDQMNKLMELMNTDLQFSLHEKTKRLIVQMVDKRDGTVLKEFPPHELLDTIANIQEYVGILLDKKA